MRYLRSQAPIVLAISYRRPISSSSFFKQLPDVNGTYEYGFSLLANFEVRRPLSAERIHAFAEGGRKQAERWGRG